MNGSKCRIACSAEQPLEYKLSVDTANARSLPTTSTMVDDDDSDHWQAIRWPCTHTRFSISRMVLHSVLFTETSHPGFPEFVHFCHFYWKKHTHSGLCISLQTEHIHASVLSAIQTHFAAIFHDKWYQKFNAVKFTQDVFPVSFAS